MNISFAAKALGGDVAGRGVLCPGPGHSARDRSLSVTFNGDDLTVFSRAGDDWRECKDYVRARLGLGGFTPSDPRPKVRQLDEPEGRERTRRAMTIWHEALPIAGTPAEAYLASRGVSYQGEALRWHPFCPFGKERLGCMVALVRNIVTDEPQAVHRTAIDAAGKKLSHLGSNGRLSFGPVGGGAVKLTDDADVSTVIAIGEGIETALSICELTDLGNMPVWSVLSAGGITAFPVLPGIESVWIAADNDASGTGQKAARAVAERLNTENIETIIIASTQAGADLNDNAKAAHRA
ncbi:DUF7146 domain-containing protein [Leptospira interrogans]